MTGQNPGHRSQQNLGLFLSGSHGTVSTTTCFQKKIEIFFREITNNNTIFLFDFIRLLAHHKTKTPTIMTATTTTNAIVSGQVVATDATSRVHKFPSDVELAKVVFPLPQQVHNQHLTDVPELAPVTEVGHLLKVFVDHDQDFLTRNGHLGVFDATTKQPYAGGVTFVERKRVLKDRIYVLRDKDQKPIALTCVDGSVDYVNACIIYGTKPLVSGTVPQDLVLQEDGVTFYPWFRAVDDHPSYTSIDHWDGATFQPFLRARPDKAEHAVGLLIRSASEHHTFGHLVKVKHGDKCGWDLTVAPGVDPAMMLCITAAMEYIWGGKHLAFPAMPAVPAMPAMPTIPAIPNPFAKKQEQ